MNYLYLYFYLYLYLLYSCGRELELQLPLSVVCDYLFKSPRWRIANYITFTFACFTPPNQNSNHLWQHGNAHESVSQKCVHESDLFSETMLNHPQSPHKKSRELPQAQTHSAQENFDSARENYGSKRFCRGSSGSECTKFVPFSAVAAAIFTAPRKIIKFLGPQDGLAIKLASERRFSLRLIWAKLIPTSAI